MKLTLGYDIVVFVIIVLIPCNANKMWYSRTLYSKSYKLRESFKRQKSFSRTFFWNLYSAILRQNKTLNSFKKYLVSKSKQEHMQGYNLWKHEFFYTLCIKNNMQNDIESWHPPNPLKIKFCLHRPSVRNLDLIISVQKYPQG